MKAITKKIILTVNWKMNLTLHQAREISLSLLQTPINNNKIEIILYCSNIHTARIAKIFRNSPIKIGGQKYFQQGERRIYWRKQGHLC